MQQHSFIFVSTLSNKTVDVNHPTVSSELFSQNENKNQNCLEQKDYQQLLSIMATQAYEAYVGEEEDKTNKDEKSF